ncbi:MAG TPA: TIGR03564 family F420-dependent LLM class oxidoreductase [Acidimicrobiia bacterium]|nr:TIGR03564 family F420-dependent LLM class oxidoreductase [Acidimicrobiia bacterium]
MRIGIFAGDTAGRTIDDVVAEARGVAEDGFAGYWIPNIFGLDALTVLAVVGREVPRIELGTAVVPTYPRHAMTMAQTALTVQAITGNRLALGIGLSHQFVVEGMWGLSFERPVRHMREYLEILTSLVRTGKVDFDGETMHAHGGLNAAGAEPVPILLAALGTRMLELAGGVADGTVTWMTGPDTLATHTVPTITHAAEAAGRPAPRIAAGLPVLVTDDVEAGRARAASVFKVYGSVPSYRAMLDREGAAGPADIAVVGDEAAVRGRLEEAAATGVTELVAVEFASHKSPDRARTRDLLRSLL